MYQICITGPWVQEGYTLPFGEEHIVGVKRKSERHFGLSPKMLSSASKSSITLLAAIPVAKAIKKLR